MAIKTRSIDALTEQTENLYEAVVIMSKRARQLALTTKQDLDDKLQYFEGFEADLEDSRMYEEQARISIDFENRPKPTEMAIQEMIDHEIYFRRPGEEV